MQKWLEKNKPNEILLKRTIVQFWTPAFFAMDFKHKSGISVHKKNFKWNTVAWLWLCIIYSEKWYDEHTA